MSNNKSNETPQEPAEDTVWPWPSLGPLGIVFVVISIGLGFTVMNYGFQIEALQVDVDELSKIAETQGDEIQKLEGELKVALVERYEIQVANNNIEKERQLAELVIDVMDSRNPGERDAAIDMVTAAIDSCKNPPAEASEEAPTCRMGQFCGCDGEKPLWIWREIDRNSDEAVSVVRYYRTVSSSREITATINAREATPEEELELRKQGIVLIPN